MRSPKSFQKRTWMQVVLLVVAILIVTIFFAFNNFSNQVNLKQEESPTKNPEIPIPSPSFPSTPISFPISNIPAKRSRDCYKDLAPSEEKMIIECLASQVNINSQKSYIDYQWGFNMVPSIREIREDQDRAFYLFTDKGKFFVKVNNFSDLSRFEYEKKSLLAINEAMPEMAPHPLVLGNLMQGGKFLVTNFIEANWNDRLKVENQKLLARSLAQLHQKKSLGGKFGFHAGKNNQPKDNWATFFLENRWQPLWKRVLEKYPSDQELKKWGTLIGEKVIPDLLSNLPVEPVLIHGNLIFDAWDINSQTKQPWVFDTYSYFGHNEMDLSLIRYYWPPDKLPDYRIKMNEGKFFEKDFLAEYQKYKPLPPGFEERKNLYRFYDWLFRQISRDGHPHKKFLQKVLIKIKKLAQKK